MQDGTHSIIRVTLSNDPTVTDDQRKAILDFCANPEFATEKKAPTQYLSVKSFAGLLDIDERTVQRWIADGKIESKKIFHSRRIPETAVDSLLNTDNNVMDIPTFDLCRSEKKEAS